MNREEMIEWIKEHLCELSDDGLEAVLVLYDLFRKNKSLYKNRQEPLESGNCLFFYQSRDCTSNN